MSRLSCFCPSIIGRMLMSGALVLGFGAPVHGDVVPGAIHQWDAMLDTDGDTSWEDIGTASTKRNITLSSTLPPGWLPGDPVPPGPSRVAVSSSTLITHAYEFDGIDDYGDFNGDNFSGANGYDGSFDIWFKLNGFYPSSPDEMGLARPIFENGNHPRGVTIGLNGDTLIFTFGAPPNEGHFLMYDLDTDDNGIPDNEDFIHVAITINDGFNEPDPDNDWIRLYIDGGNMQELSVTHAIMDWSSKDDSGLGRNVGQEGGGQDATDSLGIVWGDHWAGQIATLREYRFTLTSEQVMQNYLAMIPAAIPGDGNDDGVVDGLDYLVWAGNYGDDPADDPPGSPGNGDYNDDGIVDGVDYLVWAAIYGTGLVTAVPEPSAMLLGLWGVAGLLTGRRRSA